jgi:hypothetical protein
MNITPHSVKMSVANLTHQKICVKTHPYDKLFESMKIEKGKHILCVGEIQSGKSLFLIRYAAFLKKKYDRPIIILLRNSTGDRIQLCAGLDKHNETEADMIQFDEAKFLRDITKAQFVQRRAVVSVSYYQYIQRCVDLMKELSTVPNYREPIIIHDEADTLNTEHEFLNVTDELFKELVGLAYCRISITGTPMLLYSWDQVHQTIEVPKRDNYYGFNSVTHVPIRVKRLEKEENPGGKIEYCARTDFANLKVAMDNNMLFGESSILITTSSKTADHKATIEVLRRRYKRVLYVENNRRNTLDEKSKEPVKVHGGSQTSKKLIK